MPTQMKINKIAHRFVIDWGRRAFFTEGGKLIFQKTKEVTSNKLLISVNVKLCFLSCIKVNS